MIDPLLCMGVVEHLHRLGRYTDLEIATMHQAAMAAGDRKRTRRFAEEMERRQRAQRRHVWLWSLNGRPMPTEPPAYMSCRCGRYTWQQYRRAYPKARGIAL